MLVFGEFTSLEEAIEALEIAVDEIAPELLSRLHIDADRGLIVNIYWDELPRLETLLTSLRLSSLTTEVHINIHMIRAGEMCYSGSSRLKTSISGVSTWIIVYGGEGTLDINFQAPNTDRLVLIRGRLINRPAQASFIVDFDPEKCSYRIHQTQGEFYLDQPTVESLFATGAFTNPSLQL